MISGLVEGLRSVARSWGLVLLLLAVNVSVAGVLAIPLAGVLEDGFAGLLRKSGSWLWRSLS